MAVYEQGRLAQATVTGIESYGIFVSLDEYFSGLIHISEISRGYVRDIRDFVKVGDVITVQILDVDKKLSQLKLSIKNINYKNHRNAKRRKIVETPLGFNTLAYKLPFWVCESKKKYKKNKNSIDN